MKSKMTKTKYNLSEQAQLCVVSLFQKALILMEDVSSVLVNLELGFDDSGKLVVLNPDTCRITDEDLEKANMQLVEIADA